MKKHRPNKTDLEQVPWFHPNDREPKTRWNREYYYGQLSITHYDGDAMLRIGQVVVECLKDMPLEERGAINVAWVHFDNGRTLLDAVMDSTTGKWRHPKSDNDQTGWGTENTRMSE